MNPIIESVLSKGTGVVGIDPGKSGAVALLVCGHLIIRRDFPSLEAIADATREIVTYSSLTRAVIIEGVHAMPGQGVCSMFSFGTAFGVAQGAVWACCSLPVTFVSPQKWQNWFRKTLGIGKETAFDSRAIALELFPAQQDLFCRKKDHNSADAALMAVWGLANI